MWKQDFIKRVDQTRPDHGIGIGIGIGYPPTVKDALHCVGVRLEKSLDTSTG